jgi:hypothetical protein
MSAERPTPNVRCVKIEWLSVPLTKEKKMSVESDAQADLVLGAEAAERVAGGRRKIKASPAKTRSAPNQMVAPVSLPTASPEDPQAAFPVLSGAECEPIHYGESSSTGSPT